ncbi:MAG: YciI family protein [Solirubrobacteraceae bacterium]
MLLLYANEVAGEQLADREAEIPTMWSELNRSLEEAGLLTAAGRLHPTTAATTVSAISGETELTDGPFAITKEALAGYYLIEAENLDQALGVAKRIPLIRYGRVEVRPVM